MEKNKATKWIVFAYTVSTGLPKTGDAANITASVRLDGGADNPVDDTNPTELAGGYYVFDITAAECNADSVVIIPASATSGVQVIGVPGAVWTINNLSSAQVTAAVPTASAIATAVLSAATSAPIAADIQSVNDVALTGNGSTIPWGPE